MLFNLPPVERRPQKNWLIKNWVYWNYSPENDESYLFLKVYFFNLLFNAAFISAFLFSYYKAEDLELGPFKISYDAARPLHAFLYNYPLYVFFSLIIFTIIYVHVLFFIHSDYLKSARFKSHPGIVQMDGDSSPVMSTARYFLPILFFGACLSCLFVVPEELQNRFGYVYDFMAPSTFNLFFFVAVYLWLYQILIVFIAYNAINFARNILWKHIYRRNKL